MIHVFEDRSPTLEEAQRLVGGLVEMVRVEDQPDWQVLVNEEGLIDNLPFNREASLLCGSTIVGDVVVLKGDACWK